MNDTTDDGRYSITLESCGSPIQLWVVRFCGEWVGAHVAKSVARQIANEHNELRLGHFRVPMRTYR